MEGATCGHAPECKEDSCSLATRAELRPRGLLIGRGGSVFLKGLYSLCRRRHGAQRVGSVRGSVAGGSPEQEGPSSSSPSLWIDLSFLKKGFLC